MNAPIRRQKPITFDGLLAFIDTRPETEHWALIEGELIMMAGGTQVHARLAASIGTPLNLAMNARGCLTFLGEMYVRNPADDEFGAAPDIVVRCGPIENKRWVEDPIVIVEVLSPSTMKYDRGRKLEAFQRFETLRHVALVYQDEMRIELISRDEGKAEHDSGAESTGWRLDILHRPDHLLRFAAVDFAIPLEQVYLGVPLTPPG